jgi:hypothetical protein
VNFRKAWNIASGEKGLGCGYKVNIKYVQEWQGKLQPVLSSMTSAEPL